jgi:2-C-methyl-D-erythritol 4-phosphate cytidylyltransferase
MAAADVEAIIQGAGQGTRLGLGPKAFVVLAGRTLLERAVATMRLVASRVTVAVPAADQSRAEDLVGSASTRVIAGGTRRIDTLASLVGTATAPWLLLHDVAHPWVTGELALRVMDEARRSGAAVAALPNVDFLYGKDGMLRAEPGELLAIQKPVAFMQADARRGFAAAERTPSGDFATDAGVLGILALAGRKVAFVPGHRMNCKLTTSDDFELARCLGAQG